ncbi:ATP-binding protein [Aliarcobacter skirrowii]|uniref:ATP-binding protein n=1 Tax=Aliarcobacter skirrowii TaxID=28200 RepID=UPI0029B0FE67|nr:ATP-binding protein [Aliarcobacter skirrowii]MDX3960519.1 ATP-binding protein [Aliarcobacter skirrowii]
MLIKVGEVIAVKGILVTLKIFENSSKDTLYYDGNKYKGISIREYISIQRGFRDIICIIEGEYLDENKVEKEENKTYYIRKIEAKPIGYFEQEKFYEGIKFLPMIKDVAFLLKENKISEIYSRGQFNGFVIGKMLKEDIPISLPWQKLFNTHIGIFGNTGSGKSNTLAKLYTVLFEQKLEAMNNKSKFVILDFNGEYTANQLVGLEFKNTLHLNTNNDGQDKFPLHENEFWNSETLSILFQATANTQRPFLNRIINGRKKFIENSESLLTYIKKTFKVVFTVAAPKGDTLDLLRSIIHILNISELSNKLKDVTWMGHPNNTFKINGTYFNADGVGYENVFETTVNSMVIGELNPFDELIIRTNLQLINDLIYGYVQFEHIQPLLKRIEASLSNLKKVVSIENEQNQSKLLTVVSFRKCNQEIKKVLPLLIAKHFYHQHKDTVENPPNKTMHLIIDEAHNILSQQSIREQESWKDYRLELFEEIIKEGRKFGMFITLSSQRPADISPTIISQLHNFFIHRLVNDRDLFLLDNTISTLDNLSRNLIPNLSKGCCVVTGTSFDLPMVLQIDCLERVKQPDSEDVNLDVLWC